MTEYCQACRAEGAQRHAGHVIRIEAVFGPGSSASTYLCEQHYGEYMRHVSQIGRTPEQGFGFTG
jgi:hypothetical protein